ncbi:MAG: hypothetical protein AAB012_05185, partial [Nitrospirota bacterium]
MKNILSFLFCVLFLISCAAAKHSSKSVSDVLPEIEKKSDPTVKEPSIETKGAELKVSDYV